MENTSVVKLINVDITSLELFYKLNEQVFHVVECFFFISISFVECCHGIGEKVSIRMKFAMSKYSCLTEDGEAQILKMQCVGGIVGF